jgi:hypothetical protein
MVIKCDHYKQVDTLEGEGAKEKRTYGVRIKPHPMISLPEYTVYCLHSFSLTSEAEWGW